MEGMAEITLCIMAIGYELLSGTRVTIAVRRMMGGDAIWEQRAGFDTGCIAGRSGMR